MLRLRRCVGYNGPYMKTRGFTLIELLVVIAIIGLLATIVIASLSTVQGKARDTRRLEDVNSLQKGLALYLATNGAYPISVSTTTLTGADSVSTALIADGSFSAIPKDPQTGTYDYTYSTNASGSTYMIAFCLETSSVKGYSQGCGNYLQP